VESISEYQAITGSIRDLLKSRSFVLVAIDGYGGSGKTTLARSLQTEFTPCSIITLDDFATDVMNGADRERFLSQVLLPLADGRAARYQQFDWRTKQLAEWLEVEPVGVIICEGVSIAAADFSPHYHFRIWIDCSLEIASDRMHERDKDLHNPTYFNVWEKEDAEYAKTEPWNRADFIIHAPGSSA
jgi:uridine kinase